MNNSKIASIWDQLDVLARAQFFEGYLKMRPFGLTRGAMGKPQLLKAINKALLEIGGTPSPLWASPHDTGLYKTSLFSVSKLLKSSAGGEQAIEPSDLLQNLMGLAGWVDDAGDAVEMGGKSPFWAAGKHIAERDSDSFKSGKLEPRGILSLTTMLIKRRALDITLRERDREKKRQEQPENITDETYGDSGVDDEDLGNLVKAVFDNPESSLSKKFFGWLTKRLPYIMPSDSSSRGSLLLRYIDLLKTGTVDTDVEAAKILGVQSSGLSNAKVVFSGYLTDYLNVNPKAHEDLLGLFSDSKFYQNLLEGHVQGGRVARLAKKVAARYLRQNNLRSKLIRLAHQKPELQSLLLPLLKQADLEKSAKVFKFKKDVKLKSGTVITKGAEAQVKYNHSTIAEVIVEGIEKSVKISVSALTQLLEGYPKMPPISRLEKMSDDGIATTPTGKRTEPDGYGDDGSPSWLLVAGVI